MQYTWSYKEKKVNSGRGAFLMKKKRKNMWKRAVASLLELIMLLALTVGSSLAFLHTESNEKTNVFTSTNDIKLYLDEPSYNLRETKDGSGNVSYELKNTSQLDPREYVPGMAYPKDPTLYNITGQQKKKVDNTTLEYAEEWVAMRVDYGIDSNDNKQIDSGEKKTSTEMSEDYVGAGNSTSELGIIEPITFSGNWIKITSTMTSDMTKKIGASDKYEIYVYKYKLKANESLESSKITNDATMDGILKGIAGSTAGTLTAATTPLFSEITIKDQKQLEKNGYSISTLKYFSIDLKGAAIKNLSTISATEIKESDISNTNTDSYAIVDELLQLLLP